MLFHLKQDFYEEYDEHSIGRRDVATQLDEETSTTPPNFTSTSGYTTVFYDDYFGSTQSRDVDVVPSIIDSDDVFNALVLGKG